MLDGGKVIENSNQERIKSHIFAIQLTDPNQFTNILYQESLGEMISMQRMTRQLK